MEKPSEPLPASSAEPAVPAASLWNRDFFLLWQGQTVSQLGNQAFHIAMMSWLLKATGSASLMGLIMFTAMLPGVVLGPVGGTFADRHSRIRIALICDLLSGAAILALSPTFRMIPKTYDGAAVDGCIVRIPIRFIAPAPPPTPEAHPK